MAAYGWGYLIISLSLPLNLGVPGSIQVVGCTHLKLDDSLLKPRTSHSLRSGLLALSPGRRTIGSLQLTVLFSLDRLLDEFRVEGAL